MSLQVWLPLNGDLENKGLDVISYTGTPAYETSKKLPQGVNVKTSSLTITSPALDGAKNFSVAFWVMCKSDSTITRDWNQCLQLGTRTADGASGAAFRFESTNTHDPRAVSTHNNTAFSITSGSRVLARNKDQWYHVCVTYDGAHVYYYSNGAYIGTDTGLGGCLNGKIIIGHNSYPGTINDLRVYDHVLSQKEINEIHKTKVLHYKLKTNITTDNILKNSKTFKANWGLNSASVKTDNAFNGFTSVSCDNTAGDTTKYIDVLNYSGLPGKLGQTYTMSCWVRGSGQFIAYLHGASGYIQCAKSVSSQGVSGTAGDGSTKVTLSNVWQKIWIQWTLKTTGDETITKTLLYRLYGGNKLEIAMPKLILGDDTDTPWSPHTTDSEYTELGYDDVDLYDQSGLLNVGKKIDVTKDGYFNGTTSTINKIPNPIKTANNFTIATWAKFDATGTYTLCTARTGTGVGLAVFYIGGKIRFDDGNLQTTFTPNVPSGEWIHIAITRSTTAKSLYINGVLKQTINEVGDLSAMGINMSIGASCYSSDGVGSANFMKGYYDDFRIYSITFDAAAIKQLYEAKAQIDNYGNTYTKLFVEDENEKLKVNKDAEIITKNISERLKTYDMKIDFLEDGSIWARVFYHNNKAKTVLFKSVDECRNIQTEDKYSRLAWLDEFRGSDGKFEFMLKYPHKTTTQYNRWKQSNNPCNEYWPHTDSPEEKVVGYEPVHIDWTTSHWGGLYRQSESTTSLGSCYLSGSVGHNNWFYAIGAANTHEIGIPAYSGSTDGVVELWVRIDNALIERNNLIPTNSADWEQGSINSTNGELYNDASIYNQRIRMKDFGVLNPEGGLHRAYISNQTDNEYNIGNITYYDENKTYIKTEKDISGQISFKDLIITPPTNARYYKAIMRNGESGDIVPSAVATAKPMLYKQPNICPIASSAWESGNYDIENGIKQEYNGRICLSELLPVESGESYYFNTYLSPHLFVIREMDAQGKIVKSLGAVPNNTSVTLQSNTKSLAVTLYNSTDGSITSASLLEKLNNLTLKPLICLTSEKTKTYEEYNKDKQTVLTTAKFGNKYININQINEI